MDNQRKVAIYCRSSTNEQGQVKALDNQIRELTEFVHDNPDWILVDTYIDKGKSGRYDKNRIEYQRMISDIKNGMFHVIVIKDIDRLARNMNTWDEFKKLIDVYHMKLFIYLENDYLSIDNMNAMDEKAKYAEYYSKNLSLKSRLSAKQHQKMGVVYGNGKMLGYDLKCGRLVINEEEALIIKQIFQWYADGLGFRKISNKLDEMGIKSSTGTKFSQTTLKRIIKQEKYRGLLISGKTKTNPETHTISAVPDSERIYIEGGCPRIISDELWFKANECITKRRRGNNMNKYQGVNKGSYLLSNKIICGKCNKTYWHNSYTTKVNKLQRDVWNCSTYRTFGTKGCQNITLQNDIIVKLSRSIVINNCPDVYFQSDKDIFEVIEKIIVNNNNDIVFYLNSGIQRVINCSLLLDMERDKDAQ